MECRNVLIYGLEGVAALVRSLDTDDKRWAVDLESGEHIQFVVTETSDDERYYHVATIDSHGPNVFPGVDISSSRVFIQFSPKPNGNTLIEFGWGGSVQQGDPDVAITAVTALGQQWVHIPVTDSSLTVSLCSWQTSKTSLVKSVCTARIFEQLKAIAITWHIQDAGLPDMHWCVWATPIHPSQMEIPHSHLDLSTSVHETSATGFAHRVQASSSLKKTLIS